MSATYEITIEALEERTVRARVLLLNFQYPEVPANKCLGLQLLADAYHALRDSYKDTNQTKKRATKLAAHACVRLVAYSEGLQANHDEAFNEQLIESAEAEIVRITELSNANFEKAAAWHAQNNSGSPELPAFRDLHMVQILEFEVADARLLDHLVVGLTWETRTSARDEAY